MSLPHITLATVVTTKLIRHRLSTTLSYHPWVVALGLNFPRVPGLRGLGRRVGSHLGFAHSASMWTMMLTHMSPPFICPLVPQRHTPLSFVCSLKSQLLGKDNIALYFPRYPTQMHPSLQSFELPWSTRELDFAQ